MCYPQFVAVAIVGADNTPYMNFITVLIVAIPIFIGIIVYLTANSADSAEWHCPHGYDDFGCQPSCPLHEHCWGKEE